MINNDEMMETNACDTNIFTESISEVRLVNNFDGLAFKINE